jgi:hypothetical protein
MAVIGAPMRSPSKLAAVEVNVAKLDYSIS